MSGMPNNEEGRRVIQEQVEAFLRRIAPDGDFEIKVTSGEDGSARVDMSTTNRALAEVFKLIDEERSEL